MNLKDQTLRLIDNAQDQVVTVAQDTTRLVHDFFSFGICGCDCDHKGQRKWTP